GPRGEGGDAAQDQGDGQEGPATGWVVADGAALTLVEQCRRHTEHRLDLISEDEGQEHGLVRPGCSIDLTAEEEVAEMEQDGHLGPAGPGQGAQGRVLAAGRPTQSTAGGPVDEVAQAGGAVVADVVVVVVAVRRQGV